MDEAQTAGGAVVIYDPGEPDLLPAGGIAPWLAREHGLVLRWTGPYYLRPRSRRRPKRFLRYLPLVNWGRR